MTKYIELKNELKSLAKEIRKLKYKRDHWQNFDKGQWWYASWVSEKARSFRHKHIAYCMLRGRKYEEIERSCNTPPNFDFIDDIIAAHEIVCNSA
jgi:hypothetical protein